MGNQPLNTSTALCQNVAQAFRLTLAANDPLLRKPGVTTYALGERIFELLSERRDAGNSGPPVACFDTTLAALRQLPGNRDRDIDSDTPMATLVPRFRRVKHWRRLCALTGVVLPAPLIPEWLMTILSGVSVVLVIGVMVVIARHLDSAAPIDPHSPFGWLMRGVGRFLGFAVLFVGMIIAMAGMIFLLSPFVFALPKEVETVGDLVSLLTQASMRDRRLELGPVLVKVQLLVADACGLPYQSVEPTKPIEEILAERR